MDKIAQSIETVCLVSMLGGILCALIPSGRMKGAFSSFCAVILIFTLIFPLGELKYPAKEIFYSDREKADKRLVSDVKTAEAMLFEGVASKAVADTLAENGYEAVVEAECESVDGEVVARGFTVTGAFDENEKKAIESFIKQGFAQAAVSFREGLSE